MSFTVIEFKSENINQQFMLNILMKSEDMEEKNTSLHFFAVKHAFLVRQ